MAFNTERVAAFYNKEILKYPKGFEAVRNAIIDGSQVVANADSRFIVESGTVMVYVGVDEVQTVTIGGGPTGGTFTLTYDGQTTAAIAFNAAASAVKTALEALSNIGVGDVTVTGSAGGPYTITFTAGLGRRNVAQLTSTSSLTGGTPTITHATTTAGGSGPASGQKVRPAAASGIASGDVAGILQQTVEIYNPTENNKTDAPASLFFDDCIFDASKLVNYSSNAAAVKTALPTCTFE